MTFGQMMAFIREKFPGNDKRNGSILKQLLRRYGPDEVEIMLRGAAARGWKDLRGLYSKEGVGRRWAQQIYWASQKRAKMKLPEPLKEIFRKMSE